MHENADIAKDQQATEQLLSAMLSTLTGGGGGGARLDEKLINRLANDILERLPDDFDIEMIQKKWPVTYEESMNTVLHQECIRYNRLTSCIRNSLRDILKAMKGLAVMTSDLEALGSDLCNGRIPIMWQLRSYPSLKTLASYVEDVLARLKVNNDWYKNGIPINFWLSGFFFTHGFLTGCSQNYARKYTFAIDTITFEFEIMEEGFEPTSKPEDGCYCHGLFIEAARWDVEKKCLGESEPKVLFTSIPTILFKPVRLHEVGDYPHFRCPVYRTYARAGTLSTTGHSTNFVMPIKIPTDIPEIHWTRRGVACLLSLMD